MAAWPPLGGRVTGAAGRDLAHLHGRSRCLQLQHSFHTASAKNV
jgi:hypothetical protein